MVTFSYLPPLPMKQTPGLPNPVTASPAFRRRRMIWFLLACITCTFLFFFSSIPLFPSSLFEPSPPQPNSLHRDVLELHGLQHFVLNSGSSLHKVLYKANRDRPQGVPVHDHARNGDDDDGDGVPDPEHERLDPAKEIDLKVYSSFDGDDDWVKHVRELQNNSPLVVFSKVRSQTIVSLRSSPKLCGYRGRPCTLCYGPWFPPGGILRSFCLHFSPTPRRNEKLMGYWLLTRITTAGSFSAQLYAGHSKSYCPFSKRAKNLIQTYALDPPPRIVEVDLRGKRSLYLTS